MATAEHADRDNYLLDWLKQPGNLRIAEYQRAYCWPESFVTNFAKTFLAAEGSDNHSGPEDIGLVVLETHDENGLKIEEIADGQQRLLTFALLAVELFGPSEFKDEKSRIRTLLDIPTASGEPTEQPFLDVETLVRADEAHGVIRKIVNRLPEAVIQASRGKLCQITFGYTELKVENPNAKVDRSVERLFEAFNTTAKPLNGGQILKARHYGAIADPARLTELESIWQNKIDGKDEKPKVFLPITRFPFNRAQPTNDEFIDASNDDAWYVPGYGFAQSVQAILLGQGNWWHSLNMQGQERLDPFDRMEGRFAGTDLTPVDAESSVLEHRRLWLADSPLEFAKGWGFFGMVDRLKSLYADLAAGYEGLTNREQNKTASGPGLDDRNELTRIFYSAVDEAIESMKPIRKYIDEAASNPERFKHSVIQAVVRNRTDTDKDREYVRAALNAMSEAHYWLGISKDTNKGENSSGCVLVAVFAVLLCWADRFGVHNWRDDEAPVPNFSEATKRTLAQLALWMLLAARFDRVCRYDTVLARLHTKDAVDAALFSHDLDNAWWRFMKQVRYDWQVKNFFVGLREFFDSKENDSYDPPENLRSLIAAYLD